MTDRRTRSTPRRLATAVVLSVALAGAVACDRPSPDAQGQADPGAPWFTDATAEAGLALTHQEGDDQQWDIRPTMGPGAAWADVDGDDDPDLFVVGGSEQTGRLFLNDGSGRFEDGTASWGLDGAAPASGMGACFADWDGDGDPDLYVTNDGPNVMWRNDGSRFTDVTQAAGTGDDRWGASAAFADVDGDRDLDLFVTNYLEFDLELIPPESAVPGRRREDPLAMLPYVFPGQPNVLYRNEGDGRFTDVTEAAGLLAPDGKSLGAVFFDPDDDGDLDLYVANDTTPNTFWENDGFGVFEELSLFVGLDDPRGGMGLAPADMDADGDIDLLLTNWQLEPNALYRNNRVHRPSNRRFMPRFEDVAVQAGLAQRSVGYVGWGCLVADLDGDGDVDAYVANGYTSPDYETTMLCVGQPDQLFENVSGSRGLVAHKDVPRWEPVDAATAGAWIERALPSRGLAAADADGDGDLDLVVTANNAPLVFLRNERGGRSLRVTTRGVAPNTAAVGARVTLFIHGRDEPHEAATVHAGAGYLGNHEPTLHFGLGEAVPRLLQVTWPDGRRTEHTVGDERTVVLEQAPG